MYRRIMNQPGGGGAATLTGDASGTTAAVVVDQARGLKSATTTVSVSAATAPSSGQVLMATASTTATWQALPAAAAIGSTTQVLFNNAGTNSGDSGMTYVAATDVLSLVGAVAVGSGTALSSCFFRAATPTGSSDILGYYSGGDRVALNWNTATQEVTVGNVAHGFCQTGNYIRLITYQFGTIQTGGPVVGDAAQTSPYSSHGGVAIALPDADYALSAAQYAMDFIKLSTSFTTVNARVITFPAPASMAKGYYKTIFNASGTYTNTISTGTGTTCVLAILSTQRFWFDDAGVKAASTPVL